jgi:hypothetical protein
LNVRVTHAFFKLPGCSTSRVERRRYGDLPLPTGAPSGSTVASRRGLATSPQPSFQVGARTEGGDQAPDGGEAPRPADMGWKVARRLASGRPDIASWPGREDLPALANRSDRPERGSVRF